MFIGWIRQDSFEYDLDILSKLIAVDKHLVLKTFEANNALCFGAYDGDKLKGVISAYEDEEHLIINNFYYDKDIDTNIKKRLVKILLNNIDERVKPILFMSKDDEKELFKALSFKVYAKFKKALYSGGAVFNFSTITAKSINNEKFSATNSYTKKLLLKQSSLILSTTLGYQHSYAINKSYIKISPWIMNDVEASDAEKIMRGVLYYRGLKRIFAFIPSKEENIVKLYKSYKFELSGDYFLLYLNKKPSINLGVVYAF